MFLLSTNKIHVKLLMLTFMVFSISANLSKAQLTTDYNPTIQAIINNLCGCWNNCLQIQSIR